MLLHKGAGGHPLPLEPCDLKALQEVVDGGRARGEAGESEVGVGRWCMEAHGSAWRVRGGVGR